MIPPFANDGDTVDMLPCCTLYFDNQGREIRAAIDWSWSDVMCRADALQDLFRPM